MNLYSIAGYSVSSVFARFHQAAIMPVLLIVMTGGLAAAEIHDLVLAGDGEAVRALLERSPAAAGERSESGDLPLILAASRGQREIVELLLAAGADVEGKNEAGQTALVFAAYVGQEEISGILIDHGAKLDFTDGRGNTPLHYAARMKHPGEVRLLLERGAGPDVRGNGGRTPFYHAAAQGDLESAKMLFDAGAAMDTKDEAGRTSLYAAAVGGHADVVDWLIGKGALDRVETEEYGGILFGAALMGLKELAETMLSRGADILFRGPDGRTILHGAVAGGMKDLAGKAISAGVDVNGAGADGATALHLAVEAGDREMVEFLAGNGADVNLKTASGLTPYGIASDWGRGDILKVLRGKGAVKDDAEVIDVGKKHVRPVTIQYIGNDGFLVSDGKRKVLLDALHKNPWGYPETGERAFRMMCEGGKPFDGVDLHIASHAHSDHFNADMTLSYLNADPKVRFIGNRPSIDELRTAAGDGYSKIERRVVDVNPEWGTTMSMKQAGIGLEFFGINHAPADMAPYMTLATIVEIGGLRILHLADNIAECSADYVRAAMSDGGVDIAFIDPFFLQSETGGDLVRNFIRPEYIVLMHMRDDEVDRYMGELSPRYPGLLAFKRKMERKVFE
ncbi:MAG: ankyrin repeat domain-containing protein [Candidatus Krumholzibacteria bacterium]|jgi:ankyrin repeat protein/L-ascorbate metabolism protein UlaG (beta-lactamase superfamily)|nr:ankyrin repeat domain-containing protein [Candidatus Krumholzibacteria bacterium]